MKAILLLLIVCCSHNGFCQLRKASIDSIGPVVLQRSKQLAFETYSSKSALPKLSPSTATTDFMNSYHYEKFATKFAVISESYGKLVAVNLHEVLKDYRSGHIFRYKASYENTDDVAEIRVYVDASEKFDGIIFKPIWFDKYYSQSESAPFIRIDVDSLHQIRAYEFARRSFASCWTDNFLNLTSENATRRLRNSLTKDKLRASCEKLSNEYGQLIEFELYEILSDDYRIIYRYKAKYDKAADFLEFRVSTDMEHKFGGILWINKFVEDYQQK